MKRYQRAYYSLILKYLPGGIKAKTEFIRKYHLFGSIGENCSIQKWKLPLYSNMVFIHNNVRIASNVGFVTHDIIHKMLNNKYGGNRFVEKIGCIEIMDNVFVGSGTRILYGTRIGSNVIIGSGSLVNKDIPDNSVYAGVPARFICTFDDYVKKAEDYSIEFRERYGIETVKGVDDRLASMVYEKFIQDRAEQNSK